MAVAYDVVFTFSSILLIAGVASERRFLLVPWLVVVSLSLVGTSVFVLAGMFSLGANYAVFIVLASLPFFAGAFYIWYAVYSTYLQMTKDNLAAEGGRPGEWTLSLANELLIVACLFQEVTEAANPASREGAKWTRWSRSQRTRRPDERPSRPRRRTKTQRS